MPDNHRNFAYATVATAPSPATSGTSLVVSAGVGAIFPTVPFNATVWPVGVQPLVSNAEIVRVTARTADTLTIVRAQESSTARAIVVGDQIAATITVKTLADIESGAFASYLSAYTGLAQEVLLGDVGGKATVRLGSDVSIFRAATDVLGTNDTLNINGANIAGDGSGATYFNGGTFMTPGGSLFLPAGSTGSPSIRLPHGVAPTSPTNGDVWTTTAGVFARINGSTIGPLGSGTAGPAGPSGPPGPPGPPGSTGPAGSGGTTTSIVRLRNSLDVAIPDGSGPRVNHPFDTEMVDPSGMHTGTGQSTAAGNDATKITILVSGFYYVTGGVTFESGATGIRAISIVIDDSFEIAAQTHRVISGAEHSIHVCTAIHLDAGNVLRLAVYQDTGGSLDSKAKSLREATFAAALLSTS